MSKLSELKAKAEELLDAEFIWYSAPDDSNLSIGINWGVPSMVIIDLIHPDGLVIQDAGSFDVNTVYLEEEN